MTAIIKVLSIRQPWAWLITAHYKDIENRSWPTKFRGQFYVHASQKFDKRGYEWVRRRFPKIKMPDAFGTGGIVGTATLVDCVTVSKSPWFEGENYGFVLQYGRPCEFVPMKGKLGFFNVPPEIAEKMLDIFI